MMPSLSRWLLVRMNPAAAKEAAAGVMSHSETVHATVSKLSSVHSGHLVAPGLVRAG